MDINKAHFVTDGDNLRLAMPFSKVDAERRIVSGFATLDNVDKQMDIVTPEASMNAFSKFRGNIREMHQPSAVGKMVAFKEDKYFDPESKKFYSGIYVSAYVSKGAQNAWEKVLDGTYTGFSIGGRMNKWDDGYDEKLDAPIRIIKDYDLVELSLVDSPANQFASILSVEKVNGVDTIQGDIIDIVVENVFYDKDSGIILLSQNDSELSPVNGSKMENIGFVEKSDDDKVNMVKFLVDSAKGTNLSKMIKEDNMTEIVTSVVSTEEVEDETEEVEDETVDDASEADAEIKTPAANGVKKVVKPEDADQVAEGSMDATESSQDEEEEMKTAKSNDVTVEAVTELKDAVTSAFSEITAIIKSLSDEIVALKKSNEATDAKFVDAQNDFNNLGKSIDALQADTAFRKSGDLGQIIQEPAMVEKSVWGGRFLTTSELLK